MVTQLKKRGDYAYCTKSRSVDRKLGNFCNNLEEGEMLIIYYFVPLLNQEKKKNLG